MKLTVEGVEIMPQVEGVLHKWYDEVLIENTQPYMYVQYLIEVQDFLTRVWVNMEDDDESIRTVKHCTNMIIQIKDDLSRFVPCKNYKENDE